MKGVFTYHALKLEYIQIGEGEETFFAFHGFGRKPEDFRVFETWLKPNQRIISISLFAHGESFFPPERIPYEPLQQSEWKNIMLALMDFFSVKTFHLIGYSMGGRICLMTLQLMPESVNRVLLLAPDGLKVNLLYRFASGTSLGRKIYRSIIDNPSRLFAVAKWLNKVGILHDKLHRFVHVHLDTHEKRWQVYDAWLIYKNMFPHLPMLAGIIRKREQSFHMVFGKYDSIIKPYLGKKFSKMIGSDQHMHVVDAGHRLMTEEALRSVKGLW